MKKHILTLALVLCGTPLGAAVSGQAILKELEDITAMKTDARAQVSVTQQKAGEGTKKIEMQWFRRDEDESFMIVMTAPQNEKGNGYLRVGDNFWMYRKNTRTFQHINRDESIGGTDARGDDFEAWKLTERYVPAVDEKGKEKLSEEVLGKIEVYKFEVKAKINDVDYPKKIYWVRRDNKLILKEESYAPSGDLMQTAYYLNYAQIDGRFVAVKMLFIDEFEKGNKTIVEISDISTRALDSAIFTKPHLENLSQ